MCVPIIFFFKYVIATKLTYVCLLPGSIQQLTVLWSQQTFVNVCSHLAGGAKFLLLVASSCSYSTSVSCNIRQVLLPVLLLIVSAPFK